MQGDACRTNGINLNQTVFSTLAELPPGNMGHWNFYGNIIAAISESGFLEKIVCPK